MGGERVTHRGVARKGTQQVGGSATGAWQAGAVARPKVLLPGCRHAPSPPAGPPGQPAGPGPCCWAATGSAPGSVRVPSGPWPPRPARSWKLDRQKDGTEGPAPPSGGTDGPAPCGGHGSGPGSRPSALHPDTPADLSESLSQAPWPAPRASRRSRRASSSEPRLGRAGSNRSLSSTTRLRRSSSWVTLFRHRCHTGRRGGGEQAVGNCRGQGGHSRGVGILQEAKLIPLAVWAQ